MAKERNYWGRNQQSAAYRVDLKRAIRRSGGSIRGGAPTKELEVMYRNTVGGKLPKKKTADELKALSRR